MPRKLLWAAVFLIMIGVCAMPLRGADGPQPLVHAHAHNDYYHNRPLFDALSHGFCSVEADIFLEDGWLLVGHFRGELRPGRSLERLYLRPLLSHIEKNNGRVYPNGPEFTLLIDIKTSGPQTYKVLDKLLKKYAHILTSVENGNLKKRAVRVVLSGNRPPGLVADQAVRYAAIDGRVSDLKSQTPDHLIPLISENWKNQFSWRGEGPMLPTEREKLRDIVKKAHQANRRVRFWATPEKQEVWKELLAAEVDLINTDRLDKLRRFLLEHIETR